MRMRVGLVVVGVLAVAGCGGGAPLTPSAYVDREAHDANVVVVSYQEVQGGVQILQKSSADPATMASFQQLVSSAKDGFATAENSFVLAGAPDGTGTSNEEAATAIREFSSAMDSLKSYVDGQKPSDLAGFSTHWNQGKAFWNEAVGKLWGAASKPAPTV
jgi:outer membrane murein-binding lipoprotein Lpp